ncbi:MAG: NAD(P)H-hydrate dehydratase [Verrucomicrobia bacterium]|nr:NAD(P)H-hydrate dehydratase [Verrucomicrobiota bacterium]
MAYKSSIGHLLLIGGSAGMPGAILMAAKAAVQSGIGLTTVALPADIQPFVAPQLPEAIWEGIPCALEGSFDIDLMRRVHLNVDTFQAIVAGPGMVRDKQNLFIICRIIREVPLPLILDASALSSDCLNAFISRPKSFPKVIITPHMGEYLRVRGGKAEVYDPEDFLEFCHKFNIITLLKGSITRISDGQQLIEAPVAGPVLARGGAGDILAGMIGSLVAMDPENPLNALLKAVTWHGAAADVMAREFGQTAVRSTQLLDFLHSSLRN